MSDLEDMREKAAALEAELAAAKASIQELEKSARLAKNGNIFAHRDALLALTNHGRTSCNDNNLSNRFFGSGGFPRCNKCALLALTAYDLGTVEISVEVTVKEVR